MPDTDILRGFHGIPGDAELTSMSFVVLVDALANAPKGSALYLALEREHKKRLAEDQAEINRSNVKLGAIMGGVFGLCGVVIGAYLKNPPHSQQPTTSSAVQQVQQSNLTVHPQVSASTPVPPSASQPVAVPTPVQGNQQPSGRSP